MKNERNFIYFSDGSKMFHARGSIDDWCVYYEKYGNEPQKLKDIEYFKVLKRIKDTYGCEMVHNDFVSIYDKTDGNFKQSIIEEIRGLSKGYVGNELRTEKMFSILYMAMVSEHNYRFRNGRPTVMNKRLKRLAEQQIVIEGLSPEYAADFSRNRRVEELDEICKKYGF